MVRELTPSGADPLKISEDEFNKLIQSRKTRIKPFLLNQSFLAGIGNIYADEILHKTGIHPLQHTYTLDEMQITKLYQSMQQILRQAIEHKGSSISNYVDSSGQKGDYQKISPSLSAERTAMPYLPGKDSSGKDRWQVKLFLSQMSEKITIGIVVLDIDREKYLDFQIWTE